MVSRTQQILAQRAVPRVERRPAARGVLSVRQRVLFTIALIVFAVGSIYASIAMLTRVTPALFPGKNLAVPFVQNVLEQLPGPAAVAAPGEESAFNGRINLLIIGLDRRPNEPVAGVYRTDTIMVATIDPITKVVSALSFPRDLWIDIYDGDEQIDENRINASYGYGFERGNSVDAGAKQLMHDIRKNFGITIDHWVLMDFEAVEQTIDSLGGLELTISEELESYDFWYSKESGDPHRQLDFPAGTNTYDGYTAVAFGRNREGDQGDLLRVKRQQLVLQSLIKKIFDEGLTSRSPISLWDTYNDLFTHNVPVSKWPGYFFLFKESAGQLETYSVADPVNETQTVFDAFEGDLAVLYWDDENVQYWISKAFTPPRYARSVVEIHNGWGDDGGARAAALGSYLKYVKALPVVDLGPDVPVQAASEIVLYSADRRPMAEDIAGWMGVPLSAIRVEPRTSETQPDVLIIVGEDFDYTDLPEQTDVEEFQQGGDGSFDSGEGGFDDGSGFDDGGSFEEPLPDDGGFEEPLPDDGGFEEPLPDDGGFEEPLPDDGGFEEPLPDDGGLEEPAPDDGFEELPTEEAGIEEPQSPRPGPQ